MQNDKGLDRWIYQQNCELQQGDWRGDSPRRHDKKEFVETWSRDIVTSKQIERHQSQIIEANTRDEIDLELVEEEARWDTNTPLELVNWSKKETRRASEGQWVTTDENCLPPQSAAVRLLVNVITSEKELDSNIKNRLT